MKSWFSAISYFLFFCFLGLAGNHAFAQIQPQSQPTSAQTSATSQAVVQKDDKRTLTVLTKETKTIEIKKKDLVNDLFTPIGDVTYGIVKSGSDFVGYFCSACLNAFDTGTRWLLSPFGFKQKPDEQRTYHTKFS